MDLLQENDLEWHYKLVKIISKNPFGLFTLFEEKLDTKSAEQITGKNRIIWMFLIILVTSQIYWLTVALYLQCNQLIWSDSNVSRFQIIGFRLQMFGYIFSNDTV